MALPNQPTNTGFHHAPVCKSLVTLVGGLHLASNVPALQQVFRKLFKGPDSISSGNSLLHYIGTKLVFPDTKSAVMACVIIYFFRVFERRYGSLKFASNLIVSWFIAVSLEIVSEQMLETRHLGPLSFFIPLYIPWFVQIPLVSASQYGPLALSSKSLNYLLGLQLAVASKGSLVSASCGLLSGLLVYFTPLKKLVMPSWIGRIFSSTLGKLICTYPNKQFGLMGATIEIQRSQQAEAIEQQLLRARNRFNQPMGGGGRQRRLDEMWGGGAMAPPPAQVIPSPGHLATLVDMGFSRERADQALRQARNNLDEATNILLHDLM